MKSEQEYLLKARVDKEMHAAITRLAAARKTKNSIIVRDAIQYYLAARDAADIPDESPLQLPKDPPEEHKRKKAA